MKTTTLIKPPLLILACAGVLLLGYGQLRWPKLPVRAAALADSNQPQQTAGGRTWEYARLTMKSHIDNTGTSEHPNYKFTGYDWFLNDVQVYPASFTAALNSLGAQDWELVSVASGQGYTPMGLGITTERTMYFKRLKH
jgi:hypothetical protein